MWYVVVKQKPLVKNVMCIVVLFSLLHIKMGAITQHFAASVLGQMNASMSCPSLKCDQGMQLSLFLFCLPELGTGDDQKHTHGILIIIQHVWYLL